MSYFETQSVISKSAKLYQSLLLKKGIESYLMTRVMKRGLSKIIRFVRRPWYALLVALLAAADLFILVIPTDGLTISAVMAKPKRWFYIAIAVALGSTVGGLVLASIISVNPEFIKAIAPNIFDSDVWIQAEQYFQDYGLITIFLGAASPFPLQPFVILGPLTGLPLAPLMISFFLGRALKFLILTYIASHTPHLLKKLWGVRGEIKEVKEVKPDLQLDA